MAPSPRPAARPAPARKTYPTPNGVPCARDTSAQANGRPVSEPGDIARLLAAPGPGCTWLRLTPEHTRALLAMAETGAFCSFPDQPAWLELLAWAKAAVAEAEVPF